MNCPRCQATSFIKYGFVNDVQRYECKNCQYQWTRTTPRGYPPQQKKIAVLLYCQGISLNAISKLFAVHASSVLKWIRAFAKTYAQKSEVPNTQVVRLELDEVWHYLSKKKHKLWIWRHLIETPDTSWIGSVAVRTNKRYQNSSIASPHSTLRRTIPTSGKSMNPYYPPQNTFKRKPRHIALSVTTA